ncbi:hypothetical protein F4820DRAFT_407288 [Hypoxylon rubiginosum]|uniref:Uncharacterized protein n=1 Tax=Hypoxylon rubiginosum TaxID=110542 RepID=A0ACB9ZDY9_9PEZI|nr:hypothetical protein F4820DRAFT_407288 [Hypoxylon rubiginosum]
MGSVTPSDQEVVDLVQRIRREKPDLGRSKILDILKGEPHQWRISEARLKKLVPSVNQLKGLATKEPPPQTGQLCIPDDALAAQHRYMEGSKQAFRIYGRGKYNYGVSLNIDMTIHINIAHKRLRKAGRPVSDADKREWAAGWSLRCVWDYYVAAAAKAGVAKEDVGRQLEAEYGVPWTYMPTPGPELTGPEAEAAKARFKETSLELKRKMRKTEEGRRLIPVDRHGNIIWDEEKNGQFVVIVVKIDKGDGYQEFGTV